METKNEYLTNPKDFQCSICQKYFSRKFTLDMHLLIHKGIKPHPCPYCGKCFRQRGTLMRHKALHSADNLFFCNLCDRGFRQKNVFLHHLKHRHNVSTETLDRRKYRTKLKDYESIMDNLPSFVLANSTAISTSEKDLDAMLLEAMNGIACESPPKTGCQTLTHGEGNHNRDNEFDSLSLENSNFLIEKSDESVQELRYDCELCCLQFLDFTSYRLHIKEQHNNDLDLLDQKPFLFSVMSRNESLHLSNSHVHSEKENTSSRESLPSVNIDHSENILTFVDVPSKVKVENSKLECTLCHEFFMSEEEFGQHMESHMQEILNENVNIQESYMSLSGQTTVSSYPKSDLSSAPREISSNAKSLPNQTKLAPKKYLILKNTPMKSVSLPATSESFIVSNKGSKVTNASLKNTNKQFKCFICKWFCGSDIILKKHLGEHKFQKTQRIKNRLKMNHFRAATLNENHEFVDQSECSFKKGFKKEYPCLICGKIFQESVSFDYHRQMHLSVRSFHCGRCKLRFSDKQSLLLHTRSKHLKTFKCKSCSRTFSYRKIFDFHVRKCLNSKVFLTSNLNLPMVDIKELMKFNVEGVIGVIPLSDRNNSDENFKIGIPIFNVQHVKNISELPLLNLS